jgi:mannosyl-3-phosphoglycerate phosphatase family protein
MNGEKRLWWRSAPAGAAASSARRLVVVTDIDDSLLEPGARALPSERAALDFLSVRGIPLVITSSRTHAEIERVQETLRLLTPSISEHGSALFIPPGSFPSIPDHAARAVGGHVIEFGRPYHEVVDAVRATARELGMEIVGFADLTIEDAARELGVTDVEAQLAKLREYTELIRIADETDARRNHVFNALRRRGLRCWPTGRHHLVTFTRDRAESLLTLKALWRDAWGEPPWIVGCGNSEDDVTWLRYADVAVIVQNDHTGVDPRILSKLPTARVSQRPGRLGWSDAIFECVSSVLAAREQA